MENRLALAANERDSLWWNPEFATRGNSGASEEFAQAKIQLAESAGSNGELFGHAKNFLSKRRRKFDGRVTEQLGVQIWRRARDAGEGHVNAIRGCSRHHAENKQRFFVHEICFFSSARRLSASSGFNWSRSAPRSFSSTSRSSAVKSTC